MKLKDVHKDVERYLQHDCYCPGEIYSLDGFFYQLFKPETECEIIHPLGSCSILANKDNKAFVVVAKKDEESDPQLIIFVVDGDKIWDAVRFDATDNNFEKIRRSFNNEDCSMMKFDEFKEGSTKKSIDEILKLADAVMIS